jgi:hypothetical protein
VLEHVTVPCDLNVLLYQLLVCTLLQLVAHHDIDDSRRDRDGRGDSDRGCDRKPQPEGHGSRST